MSKGQGRKLLVTALLWSIVISASAQETAGQGDPWDGVWMAQGTPFSIRVIRQHQRMLVSPVQSLGFVWSTGIGSIHDDTATIEVEYQGARGTVVVTQEGNGSAIARALNCLPQTHLICALVQGQQVRFIKTE